jgi:uncharacterized protein (TIGR02611 family)
VVGVSRPDTSPGLSRLAGYRAQIRKLPGGWLLWRIGITFLAVLIIAVGLVLVPLPGPGWLIVFLGLGLLSTEYAWAARLTGRVRRLVGRWWIWVSDRPRWEQIGIGILGLAFTASVSYATWYYL